MFWAEIVERIFTSFHILITLGKDVTFPLITKFKTNRLASELFICKSNTELKCGLTD